MCNALIRRNFNSVNKVLNWSFISLILYLFCDKTESRGKQSEIKLCMQINEMKGNCKVQIPSWNSSISKLWQKWTWTFILLFIPMKLIDSKYILTYTLALKFMKNCFRILTILNRYIYIHTYYWKINVYTA